MPSPQEHWVLLGSFSNPGGQAWYDSGFVMSRGTQDGEPWVATQMALIFDSEQVEPDRKIWADGQSDNGGRFFQLEEGVKVYCQRRVWIHFGRDSYLDAKGTLLFFAADQDPDALVHDAIPIPSGSAVDALRQKFC
jgi:hypothetical protein